VFIEYIRCEYFFNNKDKIKINFIKNLDTFYILLKKIIYIIFIN
jgi:hypothetical protein